MFFNAFFCNAFFAAGQHFMFGLGVGCVGFGVVLILALSYYWFAHFMPAIYDMRSGEARMLWLLSSWFTFNAFFNYVHAAGVGPGRPCAARLPPINPRDRDMRSRTGEQWARFCRTCWQWKPPRAHHCSICGVCVLKMDHHCPWINGCVGYRNQKFFMNMLLYVWLATGQIAVTLSLVHFELLRPLHPEVIAKAGKEFWLEYLLCSALFLMMTFFLAWNGMLLVTNQTAIEFYGNRLAAADAHKAEREWTAPFNLGWWVNLQEAFGYHSSLFMMIFPSPALPPSDGHMYPTAFDCPADMLNPTGKRQEDDYDSDSELRPVDDCEAPHV
ncbi:putative protein S-acyltransferase 15 [Diplonema papillatum]|nr:putative protein S-acyltransferase 15 [Diplonema papillatum]